MIRIGRGAIVTLAALIAAPAWAVPLREGDGGFAPSTDGPGPQDIRDIVSNPTDTAAVIRALEEQTDIWSRTAERTALAARVDELVDALDAPAWGDRETAMQGLRALGRRATPFLEAARDATRNAEVRQRLQVVLQELPTARPGGLLGRLLESLRTGPNADGHKRTLGRDAALRERLRAALDRITAFESDDEDTRAVVDAAREILASLP